MIFPSGAKLISPKLVTKICRTKPLSVPAEEVQLLIMGVKVLLELLRAHETPIALVAWPVLFLLPEHYQKCQ